ncbi:MAG TPA: PHP-associated domain-containing protein [Vicinamibacterales bacterium]
MLKVELHAHSSDDPQDAIPHTTAQLIDRAARLGYQALALTLHDRQLDLRSYGSYAADRGVTLIPGVERTIRGKHVLLLNFRRGAEDVTNFDELAALKAREPGLVIAPHPFFPGPSCLQGLMHRYADLFDGVEFNGMFTERINFNEAAVRWAKTHQKPIVGNGDIHRLRQLDTTYSFVNAEPDPDSICEAVRDNRVAIVARPHTFLTAAGVIAELMLSNVLPPGFWDQAPDTTQTAPLSAARIPVRRIPRAEV